MRKTKIVCTLGPATMGEKVLREMLVNGMSTVDEECELEIKRTVGMVFQNPDNQLIASVVEDRERKQA